MIVLIPNKASSIYFDKVLGAFRTIKAVSTSIAGFVVSFLLLSSCTFFEVETNY